MHIITVVEQHSYVLSLLVWTCLTSVLSVFWKREGLKYKLQKPESTLFSKKPESEFASYTVIFSYFKFTSLFTFNTQHSRLKRQN